MYIKKTEIITEVSYDDLMSLKDTNKHKKYFTDLFEKEKKEYLNRYFNRIDGIIDAIVDHNGIPLATYYQDKDSIKFDEESFKNDHPDVYNLYCKKKEGCRRFLIKD